MNNNIENLIKEDFYKFIKLVNLGIIDKEYACKCIIEINNAEFIYYFAKSVKRANIERLQQTLLDIKANTYVKKFQQTLAK